MRIRLLLKSPPILTGAKHLGLRLELGMDLHTDNGDIFHREKKWYRNKTISPLGTLQYKQNSQ